MLKLQAVPQFKTEPKDTECAYLAGLIDGEGSISIFASSSTTKGKVYFRYRLILLVYNTNQECLQWIKTRFGGCVRLVSRERNISDLTRKPYYVWETGWQHAADILRRVIPYMVIKEKQASLFLEFASTCKKWGRSGVPFEIINRRNEIAETMKGLNKRGRDAVEIF